MIDIDFIIFEYLSTSEILNIFEFYFKNLHLKQKKSLNLFLGNKLWIKKIEEKYPVKVKCKYIIDPDKINWDELSGNSNAIHLLEQNLDKIYWDILSKNPNAIELLEQKLDKINWSSLSGNPNAIKILE